MKKVISLISTSQFKELVILPIFKFLFIFFFMVSCTQDRLISPLTRDERKDLEYFFRMLLFNDSGAYVLFGSKPLCFGAFIESEEKEKMQHYRRNMNKGWDVWQKIRGDVNGRRYILVKISQPMSLEWPDHRKDERTLHRFLLADVKKTALVLEKHYEFYKLLAGKDFHPVEIVYDLENPESPFWNSILYPSLGNGDPVKIHKAVGLLFGFGEENALLFSWREEAKLRGGKMAELFGREESLTMDNECRCFSPRMCEWVEIMRTPGYICFDEGNRLAEFQRDRKKIQKIYKGKNFLEITLKELSK